MSTIKKINEFNDLNDPFNDIRLNAPEIFNSSPRTRRRMSELIPNDPLREIELHAPEIFEPRAKGRRMSELIPNDPLRMIELNAPEIFH
ncbi:uncharacterized protein OCT59_010322 [Rhizophagus irregularis]|uniref:Uncharacterized protein n=2 Tax=Rhizophagus irregularis TaxID=588596 RepID=A0A915ZV17_9GLOM|nr:hypothetical protein RirG_076380 [Rhizophagus irregularis DAOM 197198w]UZO19017.1 hypothetical protein OCT59_010322 [Rhizophagus irregularis]GBC30169.1 hypothetical protein RIR_jg23904.t1 [Rhizophagus irregularis DAOM 181602=DAOM 197198]CAB4386900.1 unnamed protein product [Rhizophagus irregularis]CAB4476289.1 unnamed protein product [Rhizophagus irregularis]